MMIKFLKTKFQLLLIVLLLNSCIPLQIVKQGNNSIVAVSVTTTGFGVKGYGIIIYLENIDTHQIYKSKSLSPISPHSVIQNVPSGTYLVRKIEIPVGNMMYSNWSENIQNFFGEINIEPNSKYYLGDFIGTKEIGRKNVLKLKINNQNIPAQVIEAVETNNTGWKSGDFIKLYPYANEELLIY